MKKAIAVVLAAVLAALGAEIAACAVSKAAAQSSERAMPAASAALQEARRALEDVDPEKSAAKMDEIAASVVAARKAAEARKSEIAKPLALRAAGVVGDLDGTLHDWYGYRAGYDATFTWWVR